MSRPLALIVDDEPDIRELLAMTLARMDIDCHDAADVTTARKRLAGQSYALCLTDMRLPDGNGIELVEHIQQDYPATPVAVITAHGSMETAIQALKAGAFDFISKPVDLADLRGIVKNALKLADGGTGSGYRLIGDSAVMASTRQTIAKLARSQAPVYISGESGTGKELAARLIHEQGARARGPFVPVNCGAIQVDLIESELFGHRKGSFTGANADHDGLFQVASGGTLFLDEIADLPLHVQVKLLRAIQEKAVRPVGAATEVPVDVRIISATHHDLTERVASGQFRQDLYYRVNVIQLPMPALRERREDIPVLVQHILQTMTAETGEHCPGVSQAAMAALQAYPFPGNVRELENLLQRAVTLCEGQALEPEDLQLSGASLAPAAPGSGIAPGNGEDASPLQSVLGSVEKETIINALAQTGGNRTAAARLLGISLRAIRYRMEKLGIKM